MNYTIYIITNIVNQKVYIGQTVKSLSLRFGQHKQMSNKRSIWLYNAMNKYGRENFIIEEVTYLSNKEEADQEEMYWIARMRDFLGKKSVYNLRDGGSNTPMSPESRLKMSKAKIGTKFHQGYKHSKETLELFSRQRKGRIPWNKGINGR